MRQIALLLSAFAFLLPGRSWAQDSIDAALGRLAPGQYVRVTMEDRRRLEGLLLPTRATQPGLRLEGVDSPLPSGRIDSLWVRGKATKTGAIVGAVGGGATSFALAALICEAASEGSGCDAWGTVTALGLGGAGAGALLGAAVGAAVPKWHRRYARQRPPLSLRVTVHRRVGLAVSVTF